MSSDSDAFLLRQQLPSRTAAEASGTPTQQAFRQAIAAVDDLRQQLQALRAAQAATRQAYWRQVGPLAATVVAARRALYAPLEAALTEGYLNRAEMQQVTEVILQNAAHLHARFGEDEAAVVARHSASPPLAEAAPEPAAPTVPPHQQAAEAARARRQQAHADRTRAAEAEDQALLHNTKVAYRQLARLHHPDRAAQADAPTQQAQTALMQRITAAYAAGDLAALLALLAEVPSATPPPAESEALLGRYTQALAQQQVQLSQQLAAARQPQPDAPWSGTGKQQRTRLRQLKRDLRAEAAYLLPLAQQLGEPASLRAWLRVLKTSGQTGI